MRERMIQTIQKSVGGCGRYWAEVVADGLISNGAILPLCKVGDIVYQTNGVRIYEITINEIAVSKDKIIYYTDGIAFDETAIGQSVFLTKEELERTKMSLAKIRK